MIFHDFQHSKGGFLPKGNGHALGWLPAAHIGQEMQMIMQLFTLSTPGRNTAGMNMLHYHRQQKHATDLIKEDEKMANNYAIHRAIAKAASRPEKTLAAIAAAAPVVAEAAVVAAPVAIVGAAGYGVYRLVKWLVD